MKLLDPISPKVTFAPKITFDIEREVPHPLVVAANDAFHRIENHRKLFRTDWLPFLDGVFHLSLVAWERTGSRTNLDGKPDWTYDPTQVAFRDLIRDLPWARYIEARRPLLTVLRRIGGDRERFLAWYEGLEESVRERVGHPETLWRKFEQNTKPEAVTAARSDSEDEKASDSKDEKAVTAARSDTEDDKAVTARSDSKNGKAMTATRSDADRMTAVVTSNEAWTDFAARLRDSLNHGRSTLETKLREELDDLLEDGSS